MDADNFHSEGNITKMKQGTPLTDEVHVILNLQILLITIKVNLAVQNFLVSFKTVYNIN